MIRPIIDMFELDVNEAVIVEARRLLVQALSTTGPEMRKRLREAIFQELKAARDGIVGSIKFKSDPRGTAHAVRRYVARKYLGGVVSILPTGHTRGSRNDYEPPRKVYPGPGGKRGGNRMLRSKRTDDIMHYGPMDRDFILYYVDKGTNPRYANGRSGKWDRRGGNKTFFKQQEEGTHYRGSIAPRNFFSKAGQQKMQQALQHISQMIDEEWTKILKQ